MKLPLLRSDVNAGLPSVPLLEAPRDEAERRAFAVWCATTMTWYAPRMALGIALALILWWPTDLLIYAGLGHERLWMGRFRLAVAAVLGLGALTAPRIQLAHRYPFFASVVVGGLGLGVATWFMAAAGQAAPFWFAFGYIGPIVSVAFLQPLPVRCVTASVLALSAASGFLLGPGHPMQHVELRAGISYLAFSTALSIALGHGVYLLVRSSFVNRLRVDEQRGRLAELTERLEERVAEQTAELRQLHRRSQEVGAEERRLVARDLHDGLGQELSSLRLLVGLGRDITQDEAPRELFAELDGLVERVQLSLRSVLQALRPRLLHEQGLVEGLGVLLADTERRWGLRCTLDIGDLPDPMPTALSVAIFRICQEALHNILRHAGATVASLRLARVGGALVLEIQDDGRGMTDVSKGGYGLTNIRERAQELGGEATWSVDQGTLLRVVLPLEKR